MKPGVMTLGSGRARSRPIFAKLRGDAAADDRSGAAMRFFLMVLAVVAAFSSAVRADDAEFKAATIRSLLDAGDHAALEAQFVAAHQAALKARDFTPLRTVYSTLFATANHARLQQVEGWQKAAPDSAYAATARAWSHIHRAFLLRGTNLVRETSGEALAAFQEEMMLAAAAVDTALGSAPDFAPALDASLKLKRAKVDQRDPIPQIESLLQIAPDQHALELALDTADPRWGGSVEKVMQVCERYAPQVPGYTPELCKVQAVLGLEIQGPLYVEALAQLEKLTEPQLDHLRLRAYLREWSDRPNAASEAMRLHRQSLTTSRQSKYTTAMIGFLFDQPDFVREMNLAQDKLAEKRLQESPDDSDLLRDRVRYGVDQWIATWAAMPSDAPVPELNDSALEAMWQRSLLLGQFQADTWDLGQVLTDARAGDPDTAHIEKFWQNRVHYSNYALGVMSEHTRNLLERFYKASDLRARPDKPDQQRGAIAESALRCPLVRAARLLELVCQGAPEQPECRASDLAPLRGVRMGITDCPFESSAPPEELAYTPTPIEYFLAD
jgi:hypothetical protein